MNSSKVPFVTEATGNPVDAGIVMAIISLAAVLGPVFGNFADWLPNKQRWRLHMVKQERGRDVLPIPDRAYSGLIKYEARDSESVFSKMEQLRAPEGAPNMVVVLLDNVGFDVTSAFGSPCQTPTAERLAEDGLKYNRFHTTTLCYPTRMVTPIVAAAEAKTSS